MHTSSPLLALCLFLALGSAALVIEDPKVIARQSGCVYMITPEGVACKSLPLEDLYITSSTHFPREPKFIPTTQPQIPEHPSKNIFPPLTSSRLPMWRRRDSPRLRWELRLL